MVTQLERVTNAVLIAQQFMGSQYAVPGTDEQVLYCAQCLFYRHQPVTLLVKAVITTPMDENGKFNSEAVPTGASVWITVTNPESPLHGRPIMITKRPDNLFALTGGGGQSGDARRHMVLTGTPKKTKRDEELEEEIQDAERHNEPLLSQRRQLTAESRQELRTAASALVQSMGLGELNRRELLQRKDEVQRYVGQVLGEDETTGDEAKRITDTIMKQVVASEREVRDRVQRDRQLKVLKARAVQAREGERLGGGRELEPEMEPEMEPVTDSIDTMALAMPDVARLQGMTPEEQELKVVQHFEQQVENFFDPEREVMSAPDVEDVQLDGEDDGPPVMLLGESVKPLSLESPEQLQGAIDRVQDYWDKRKRAEEITQGLRKVPLAKVTPSVVEAIKARELEPVSMQEIEERMDEQLARDMQANTATALYDALGEHWSDDISLSDTLRSRRSRDSTMQFHVNAGAASALSAMGQQMLGTRYDVSKLINDGNIELAAASLALEVARKLPPGSSEYESVVNQVRNHNAVNQRMTETKALQRHERLASQHKVIQEQKERGELLDKVRISNLEADNLIAQRTNLGAALGSLQSSATLYDYLEKFRNIKRAPVVSVSVGAQPELAESIRSKLGLRGNYDVDISDPDNIKLNIGLSSLSRYVREAPNVAAQTEKFDQLKNNMDGVSEDSSGNLVVDEYDVPGWKDQFLDATDQEREYKWRVEQRNDIEWLKEATKVGSDNPRGIGGGLITRVTGAGKTNTALGFFGNKIAENPDYKGLVVVPKGRAAQWHEEAVRFSDTPTELIPDGTSKAQVDEILSSSKPGTIYVMGHREASRSHEMIGLMQTDDDFADNKFGGLVIDEPQELQSRGQSGNIGALGKRLMRLDFDHRVGLTATPARRNPTEAYDLIKWTQGTSKNLGSKAAFVRTFSGFGGGTNAQDTAINKLFFDTIKPYISGDRITTPNFKVNRSDMSVRRSEGQRTAQAQIERDSENFVVQRRQELIAEARSNPRSSMRTGANWENTLSRRATERARNEVLEQHSDNMNGGDYTQNGKLMKFKEELERAPDQKHVVFVESAAQRKALGQLFKDMGYNNNNIKNMAAGTGSITGSEMAARAKMFRDDPRAKVIMIDPTSSSGYNLQSGNVLHVLGAPDSGATYLQAQGRVARMPRVGDVDIKTYRYEDNPTEAAHWNDIDTQLKVLQASAPSMFV